MNAPLVLQREVCDEILGVSDVRRTCSTWPSRVLTARPQCGFLNAQRQKGDSVVGCFTCRMTSTMPAKPNKLRDAKREAQLLITVGRIVGTGEEKKVDVSSISHVWWINLSTSLASLLHENHHSRCPCFAGTWQPLKTYTTRARKAQSTKENLLLQAQCGKHVR